MRQLAVYRLVKPVINRIYHARSCEGMCGDMAIGQNTISIVLGLSLDEFSVNQPA